MQEVTQTFQVLGRMTVNAFWEGVLAGYAIAVPVGAIAILIIETAWGRTPAPR